MIRKATTIRVYTDAGSRGNPGPSAIGVIVTDKNGKELRRHREWIGDDHANNTSEYVAMIRGLEIANQVVAELGHPVPLEIHHYCDCQLVARQMSNEWKIKSRQLKVLFNQARDVINHAPGKFVFHWLSRDDKRIAAVDAFVREWLDGYAPGAKRERVATEQKLRAEIARLKQKIARLEDELAAERKRSK